MKKLAVALTFLVMGCGPQAEIKKKADFVCRFISVAEPSLDGLPAETNITDLVRKEDAEFLRNKVKADDAGLAVALRAAMKPAMEAMAEARGSVTTCEIISVNVTDSRATVALRSSVPKTNVKSLADGLERVGELSKLESRAARVAKAREWFTGGEKIVTEQSLEFVKSEQGWRADLQLPEKQRSLDEKREREERARTAIKRSIEVLEDCSIEGARAYVERARTADPESDGLAAAELAIAKREPECIGGKWHRTKSKDPMTDDVNVMVTLNSDNEVQGTFKSSRGTLVGRCAEKRLELYLATDVMLDDTYEVGIVARHRFNEEKAERVIFTRSTDYHGAFFQSPREWLKKLAARSDTVVSIELPVFQATAVVYRFSLKGTDKAADELLSACQ